MGRKVISKKDDLQELFPEYLAQLKEEEVQAIDRFFKKGNVVSLLIKGEDISLIYPQSEFFLMRLARLENLLQDYKKRKKYWEKELQSALLEEGRRKIKMLAHPLFWQHSFKKIINSEYREKSEKVELPIHLVSDQKWKPMLEAFVKDPEYRERLTDTVENSIVYSDKRKLAQQAKDITNFKINQSKRKIEEFEKKIQKLEKELEAYNSILNFLKTLNLL